VIGALFLLVLFSATVVPLISIVYVERMTIKEEMKQLGYLEEKIHDYLVDRIRPEKNFEQVESREEFVKAGVIRKCSTWTGSNGRVYEHCLHAAK
jgi:hypothetical protein